MNFVLRTLLRRVLKSYLGGNEEIKYERKDKEMKRDWIFFLCTVSELNLVSSPSFNSSRLDFWVFQPTNLTFRIFICV